MKKHDFGAWFLLCGLLFLFTPGVSAMAEETEPLFAFAAQAEEVRPGGSFAVTCTPARGDIGAFVLFADFDAEVISNAKAELPESVKSRHVYTSQQDGRFALVYTAKDGGALTEPFTLVFRTERGAEFDAVTVSFSVTDAANAVGQELIDTVQTTEKTFTYVKEPESSAALLSLIPPTGTLSPSFDPEMFQYSLSVPFPVTSLVFDAQPAEDCSVRVNRKNLGAGGSTVDFEFTVTSESGEAAVYTVAVTREKKPVTAVAGKTGTSSAAKGKDAASSEKSAESEAAEANVQCRRSTGRNNRCDRRSARRGSDPDGRGEKRPCGTDRPPCYGCHRAACGGVWLYARRFVAACFRKEGGKVRSAPRRMMHTLRSVFIL